ncbi:MAG: hypothetical protein N2512_09220 [Armatimonadetes bacterium]|nr:hypothetical protein [Armatimonadota bacterium]
MEDWTIWDEWFWQQAGEGPWHRRFAKHLWAWVCDPIIQTGEGRAAYLWWWGVATVFVAILVTAMAAGSEPATVRAAFWPFALSVIPAWVLCHGFMLYLGDRWFFRRERWLVLHSRPTQPAGPNPLLCTAAPGALVGLLVVVALSGIKEPLAMVCGTVAVWLSAAIVVVGAVHYALPAGWVSLVPALVLPVTASTWARSAAIAVAQGEPVHREPFAQIAFLTAAIIVVVLYYRLEAIRDANVRAWQELNSLLPKLATAATAGVLSTRYGPMQLERDLRRVNTPVELIRPVCILVGTVIMSYKPWFKRVEESLRGEAIEVPGELLVLGVLTPQATLREPWKWFLPQPGAVSGGSHPPAPV